MKKPTQKSGVLGLATNLNKKTNPFIPGYGLYKLDGWRLSEEAAVTKFAGIAKLNASVINETSIGGSGLITGIFNYFPQNNYTFLAGTPITNNIWTDILWVSTNYCAIANDTRQTYTSTDGKVWTSHLNALPALGYVALAYDGTRLIAISQNNKSSTSLDGGITWAAEVTMPTPATSGVYRDVAWDGTGFCAVAGVASTTLSVATSTDGTSWTQHSTNQAREWNKITSNGNGVFVIVAYDTGGIDYSLNHGVTWLSCSMPASVTSLYDVTWMGTKFVAVSSAANMIGATSLDGKTWEVMTQLRPSVRVEWNGTYVCAFHTDQLTNEMSKDGVSWFLVYSAGPNNSVPATGASSINNQFISLYPNSATVLYFKAGEFTFNTVVTTHKSIYSWNGTSMTKLTSKMDTLPAVPDFYDAAVLVNDVMYLSNGLNFNHKMIGGTVYNQGIIAPGSPLTSTTSGTGLTGVYSYKVTFVNQVLGHESNPSPQSANLSLSNQGVLIDNIPISLDPQVTARNIYRTTTGGGVWLFLKTINNNTTITTSDNASDATLGIAVDGFGNGVPPLYSMLEMWNGVAFMVPKASSRVWFSKQNFPNAVDSNDFRDLDIADGTNINGIKSYRNFVVAFKDNSIWNGFGTDRFTFGFDKQVSSVGSVNNACIVDVPVKNVLAFFDRSKRFYFYDGTTAIPAAESIEPVLKALDSAYIDKIVGAVHKPSNQCRWIIYSSTPQASTMVWYDYVQDKWGTRPLDSTHSNYIAAILDSSRAISCFLGGYSGQAWVMDSGLTDDGSAMTAEVMDRGHPASGQNAEIEEQKCFNHLFVWFKPQAGVTFTVLATMDDPDGTPVTLGTLDGSLASGQDHIHFNLIGRRCYITVRENSSDSTPTVRGWQIYYKNLGRHNAP